MKVPSPHDARLLKQMIDAEWGQRGSTKVEFRYDPRELTWESRAPRRFHLSEARRRPNLNGVRRFVVHTEAQHYYRTTLEMVEGGSVGLRPNNWFSLKRPRQDYPYTDSRRPVDQTFRGSTVQAGDEVQYSYTVAWREE